MDGERARPWVELPHLKYSQHTQSQSSPCLWPCALLSPSQRSARGPQLLSNQHLPREGATKLDSNYR